MTKTLVTVAGLLLAFGPAAGTAAASVSAADVQQWISTQLSTGPVPPPDSVVCPGDLDSVVGGTISCAVTRGDETRGVTVTVESLDNDAINLSLAPARQ